MLEFMVSELENRLRNHQSDYADQSTVACWLDASPSGLKLYQKLGWEEVGMSNFDLAQWGGKEFKVHKNIHLVKWISSDF